MTTRISTLLVLSLTLALGAAIPLAARADTAAPVGGAVGLELVAAGFTSPVALVEAPDGSGRLFIVDLVGQIWILGPDGVLLDQPFLDLRDRMVTLRPGYDERGLLGLAFHPDYAENGRFFVFYSAPLSPDGPADWTHANVVSEFHVSADDPDRADPGSEQVLLALDWPARNHNGGTVAFGPDGYLYISLGDGGGANDIGRGHVEDWYAANEGGNGQDIEQNLMGSILRVDVDGDAPYAIPADNPFAGPDPGLDEIFAYGFRNPYRFSFDLGGDNDLLVGDAGQNLWEEVSRVERGGNYGWNVKEGTHCFDAANPRAPQITDCPDTEPDGDPLIDPVIEFANSAQPGGLGSTVVGGYVYRGTALPWLEGRYIYGVWSSGGFEPGGQGRILVSTPREDGMWDVQELIVTGTGNRQPPGFVLGFGQDLAGEVYVLITSEVGPTGHTGRVYRLSAPNAAELPGASVLHAQLLGASEVPGPGDPDGFGFARIVINPQFGSVCWRMSVAGIDAPTAAHIHAGAFGSAGPVVVPLMPVDPSGLWNGCAAVDPATATAIAENPGGYYVNVHTGAYPAGALRGQLAALAKERAIEAR